MSLIAAEMLELGQKHETPTSCSQKLVVHHSDHNRNAHLPAHGGRGKWPVQHNQRGAIGQRVPVAGAQRGACPPPVQRGLQTVRRARRECWQLGRSWLVRQRKKHQSQFRLALRPAERLALVVKLCGCLIEGNALAAGAMCSTAEAACRYRRRCMAVQEWASVPLCARTHIAIAASAAHGGPRQRDGPRQADVAQWRGGIGFEATRSIKVLALCQRPHLGLQERSSRARSQNQHLTAA